MRREYQLFYKNKKLALLNDCIYYCFQTEQITVEEMNNLEMFLLKMDEYLK